MKAIGLDVETCRKNKTIKTESHQLALVPVEGEEDGSVATAASTLSATSIECPKCKQLQNGGLFCTGCGTSFADMGLIKEQTAEPSTYKADLSSKVDAEFVDEDKFKFSTLISCAIASVLGCIAWLAVLLIMDAEYGLVALLVGGMVGYAGVITGAKGQTTAIVCAFFTIMAIFSGKYFAIEILQAAVTQIEELSELEKAELRTAFLEEKQIAQEYITLPDANYSLKQFMIKYQFSFAREADDVSQQELQEFEIYSKPRLIRIATTNPDFEQWMNNTIDDIQGISSMEIIQDSFDFYDLLFLFLGVITAYRLGNNGST